MSLLLNMLSRLVIAFLPMSKRLLISWLWSPSAVILELTKIKAVTVSIVSPSICREVMGPDAMILVLSLWIYFSSPNLVLLLSLSFLQLSKLSFLLKFCTVTTALYRVWASLANRSIAKRVWFVLGLLNLLIEGAAWTHDYLGKFIEITSFPICSWFSVPSLISLDPNFCFIYQISYLPLLPCLGVTSKLGVTSTAS